MTAFAPLTLVIELEPRGPATQDILMSKRCIALDPDGVPVGELPITSFEQGCDSNSAAITTIRTYRARTEVIR